jgi:hypothetical protein
MGIDWDRVNDDDYWDGFGNWPGGDSVNFKKEVNYGI